MLHLTHCRGVIYSIYRVEEQLKFVYNWCWVGCEWQLTLTTDLDTRKLSPATASKWCCCLSDVDTFKEANTHTHLGTHAPTAYSRNFVCFLSHFLPYLLCILLTIPKWHYYCYCHLSRPPPLQQIPITINDFPFACQEKNIFFWLITLAMKLVMHSVWKICGKLCDNLPWTAGRLATFV